MELQGAELSKAAGRYGTGANCISSIPSRDHVIDILSEPLGSSAPKTCEALQLRLQGSSII